jgi:hypothetical protein
MGQSSGTEAEKVKWPMRVAMPTLTICFAITLGLLLFIFPWGVYQDNFHFAWQRTLLSYILLAAIVALLVGVVSPILTSRMKPRFGSQLAECVFQRCRSQIPI